jgi:hypothetical protein
MPSTSPAATPSCTTSRERGDIVSSVCHGYCGLLNTKLSDGSYLIAGKKMTGFAWQEEVLARVDKLVPYNAQERAEERGALYEKALIPFISYAAIDGNLVTGQNPGSAKETAKKVASLLRYSRFIRSFCRQCEPVGISLGPRENHECCSPSNSSGPHAIAVKVSRSLTIHRRETQHHHAGSWPNHSRSPPSPTLSTTGRTSGPPPA